MKTEEEKALSKKESARKWREKNREVIKEKSKEYNKKYYLKNKKENERILLTEEEKALSKKESSKKWRENNKDYAVNYKLNNFDKIKKYQKDYNNINRVELNKKIQIRKKNRYQRDINYRIKTLIRNIIKKSFNRNGFKKESKTEDILGCSFEYFKLYLESKFEVWMSWENKGLYNGELNYGWDIDHIIPLSSTKTPEDLIKLNHYTNLQPLCSKINRDTKRSTINYEMD